MDREVTRLMHLIDQGQALYEAQHYEDAWERLSLAIRMVEDGEEEPLSDSVTAQLYVLRGSALLYQDEQQTYQDPDTFHQVQGDYEQAIELEPEKLLFYKLRARLLMSARFEDYSEAAAADLERALALDPRDTDALKLLAQIALRHEAYELAMEYLDQALEVDADPEGWLLRGVCYFKQSPPRYELAAADFGRALPLMPETEELYIWRAQCFQELGRVDEAIAEYDRLLRIAPGRADYYVDRGALYAALRNPKALDDYNRALTIEAHPLAYNNRAFYFLEAGDYPAALADAEQALRLAPQAPVVHATLAEIYARTREPEPMYRHLEQALPRYTGEDALELLMGPAFEPYRAEDRFQQLMRSF
jgi:tetratricopeptide (TPR) repeat protein